ncbi:hypothetical protein M9458_007049, partial [Cirrhinus mrigala]
NEGLEESPIHCTTAEGLRNSHQHSLLLLPVIPASLALPTLFPVSPSAHPQPTICAVGLSLSRPVDPAAPPWLLAPSTPPWCISPPALLGSLVPPALLRSVVDHPLPWDSTPAATSSPSIPPALSGSSFPTTPPWSSAAPAPPWLSGSPPLPQSPGPSAPSWLSGYSASPWHIGPPSPPWAPLPPAPPQSVSLLESSTLPPHWLLPPSAAPWIAFMALSFPGSSLCLVCHSSCGFLCGSSLHHHHPGYLPALRRPLSLSHIHSFVLLLSPPFFVPSFVFPAV